jgi:hypothetical protein
VVEGESGLAAARTVQQRKRGRLAARAFHRPNGPCPLHIGVHLAKDCGVLSTPVLQRRRYAGAGHAPAQSRQKGGSGSSSWVPGTSMEEGSPVDRPTLGELLQPIGKLVGTVEQLTAAVGNMALAGGARLELGQQQGRTARGPSLGSQGSSPSQGICLGREGPAALGLAAAGRVVPIAAACATVTTSAIYCTPRKRRLTGLGGW